ncbi:MAG: hypothetical protein HY322_10695 [Betaproteobacteria bacterium]|nr:hypothetical protein [Betaproteobacteria bacterium]
MNADIPDEDQPENANSNDVPVGSSLDDRFFCIVLGALAVQAISAFIGVYRRL